MQDTAISTITSFVYEIQVNNNNPHHYDNAWKAIMKFNFMPRWVIFELQQNSLEVLSIHWKGSCNELLEYSFQLHKGKVFIVV